MAVKKYRKLPVEVEAIQWTGGNTEEIRAFCGDNLHEETGEPQTLTIRTLEGLHMASVGDYIIKGIAGEFYPCKPDIFEATYEPA